MLWGRLQKSPERRQRPGRGQAPGWAFYKASCGRERLPPRDSAGPPPLRGGDCRIFPACKRQERSATALSTPCPLQASSLPGAEPVFPGPHRSLGLSLRVELPPPVAFKVSPEGKQRAGSAVGFGGQQRQPGLLLAVFGGQQDPIKNFP